jgi:CheY-like chemotaxis protein
VPFPGGTPQDKLRAHRERAPRPVTELRPDVPAVLAQVVETMMAREPEQRYQTPGEVSRALAPFAAPPTHYVLVVDDNAAVREVMASALGGQGYRVGTAADGREALELLRRGPLPDVILLDLMMPGMDGWEFLRERRHDAALAAVPVLIISALNEDQARAMALGVAGHLQKPVELEELGAALRQHTAMGCGGEAPYAYGRGVAGPVADASGASPLQPAENRTRSGKCSAGRSCCPAPGGRSRRPRGARSARNWKSRGSSSGCSPAGTG